MALNLPRGRVGARVLFPVVLAIGLVLLWEGSLSDEAPRSDSGEVRNQEARPEPPKYLLVQGEDTEFERVPSSALPNADSTRRPPTFATQENGTLIATLSVGSDRLRQGWIEIGRQEGDLFTDIRHSTVDPDSGEARFDALRVGRYVVRDLQQLPDGRMGPRLLTLGGEYVGPSILVKPGIARLDIPLEATARVFGYLRDADGGPLDGPIDFTPIDEEGRATGDSHEVAARQGYYEADLRAGLWRGEPQGRGGRSGELQAPAEPKLVRLDPRTPARADFTLEQGGGTIEGRIVDESGDPFPGLSCAGARILSVRIPDTARPLRIESGCFELESSADGSFRAEGLSEGRYVLRVEPRTFYPFAKEGENRIGAIDRGTEIEVSSARPTTVRIVVRRPRSIRLDVVIEIAPEWRKQNAIPTLWPLVRFVADDVLEDGSQIRRTLNPDEGRFQLSIEAALRSPRFDLELGEAQATYPITIPSGADVVPLVLRFPP